MNYSLNITLTEEQNDALVASANEINGSGGNTTAEDLLRENGINYVNQRVAHYYQASIQRLGAGASVMSYTDRKALIAQISSQLPA